MPILLLILALLVPVPPVPVPLVPGPVRLGPGQVRLVQGPAFFGQGPAFFGQSPAFLGQGLLLVAPSGSDWGWPVSPPRVVRAFDPPPRPWLPGHRGVDLAAQPGALVRAAGGGVVVFAGVIAGRGVVSVAHPGGLRTTYEPVTPSVVPGDRVTPGFPLGALSAGHPGCAAAACLHWGLRRGDVYLDPLALLGLGRVRLLPLTGQPA